MKRKKSREDILKQIYLTKTDIERLLTVSRSSAAKIYHHADAIDREQLKEYRVENNKVRLSSVCKVTQTTISQLRDQMEGEAHE